MFSTYLMILNDVFSLKSLTNYNAINVLIKYMYVHDDNIVYPLHKLNNY